MNCSEFLTGVERRLEEQIERGKAVGRKLDVNGLNFKTEPAKWSAGQIFEHMMLANAKYLSVMQAAIEGAPRAKVGDSLQHTWFGKFVIKGAGPDGNAPAPKSLHPRGGSFDTTVVDKWVTQTQVFRDLTRRSHGIDLCSMRIKNPFIPVLKMNLADGFEILAEHTERHLQQIESLADKAANARQRTTA